MFRKITAVTKKKSFIALLIQKPVHIHSMHDETLVNILIFLFCYCLLRINISPWLYLICNSQFSDILEDAYKEGKVIEGKMKYRYQKFSQQIISNYPG